MIAMQATGYTFKPHSRSSRSTHYLSGRSVQFFCQVMNAKKKVVGSIALTRYDMIQTIVPWWVVTQDVSMSHESASNLCLGYEVAIPKTRRFLKEHGLGISFSKNRAVSVSFSKCLFLSQHFLDSDFPFFSSCLQWKSMLTLKVLEKDFFSLDRHYMHPLPHRFTVLPSLFGG